MGLFDFLGGDSSSSSSSTTTSNSAAGGDNGAGVVGSGNTGSVTIGSSDVATAAINAIQAAANSSTSSANTNLAQTENFLTTTLGKIFDTVGTTQTNAAANVTAAQQLASTLSSNQTATASQDLQGIVTTIGVIALIYFYIRRKG